MVLDIETGWALVPGRTLVRKEVDVQLQRVKIIRTFVGLPPGAEIGSIVEIPKSLAVQAKDAHKVEFLPEEVKPEPLKVETKKEEFSATIDGSFSSPGIEDPIEIVKKSKKG
jgi:hypothetical protein